MRLIHTKRGDGVLGKGDGIVRIGGVLEAVYVGERWARI